MSGPLQTSPTLSLKELDGDVSMLSLRLAEEQERTVGFKYCLCSICLMPVRKDATRRAIKAGRPVRCRHCYRNWQLQRIAQSSQAVLCAICRTPLTGRLAGAALRSAKRGHGAATCQAPKCAAAARSLKAYRANASPKKRVAPIDGVSQKGRIFPRLPCAVCGHPASQRSSKNARLRGTKPYCENHKYGCTHKGTR